MFKREKGHRQEIRRKLTLRPNQKYYGSLVTQWAGNGGVWIGKQLWYKSEECPWDEVKEPLRNLISAGRTKRCLFWESREKVLEGVLSKDLSTIGGMGGCLWSPRSL